MAWLLIGASQYGTEEIDEFDTLTEAREMAAEYRLAFGAGWTITIAKGRSK